MDVGDHTATGDGGLDEGVKLLVTTDGELQTRKGKDTSGAETDTRAAPGGGGE